MISNASTPINYLAVIIAAVASMAIGRIWHDPLFGKLWISLAYLQGDELRFRYLDRLEHLTLLVNYLSEHFHSRRIPDELSIIFPKDKYAVEVKQSQAVVINPD